MKKKSNPSKVANVKSVTAAKKAPAAVKKNEAQDRTPDLQVFRSAVLPFLEEYETRFAPAKPLRVLAIDPGTTNIAFAFLNIEHDAYLTSKTMSSGLKQNGTSVLYVERLIQHWVRLFRPEVIFKEGVSHGEKFGVAEAGKLQYIIERIGIEYGIPVVTIQNSTMRKFLKCKSGKNTKGEVNLRLYKLYNEIEFDSDDEADAYAIAKTGVAFISGEIEVSGKKYPGQ